MLQYTPRLTVSINKGIDRWLLTHAYRILWQAVGLLVLSHILFRGWGHRGHGWHRDRWSHRFEEKLAAMTPEEREKFKNDWRSRCGWVPKETESK